MALDILIWLIMILGLAMTIIGSLEYVKLRKEIRINLQREEREKDEIYSLIDIIIGVFYFLLGLFLIIKLIPGQYAVLYSIGIIILEKIVKYIVKTKYQKKDNTT